MGRKIIIAHFPTDTLEMDDSMIESEFNELLNPQKIIGYHNLVQLQKISGDPNFSYLMRIPLILLSFWTSFAFMSRYNCIIDNDVPTKESLLKLKGSSSNGKFVILEAGHWNKDQKTVKEKEKLFMKIQLKESGDNMMMDDVNGFMINMLANKKEHFMRYRDSFLTMIFPKGKDFYFDVYKIFKQSDRTGKMKYIYDKMRIQNIEEISRDENYNSNIEYSVDEDIEFKRASVHDLIQGISLGHFIKKMIKEKKPTIDVVCQLVSPLFLEILKMGKSYGFVHNDCHLNNIMINTQTSPLTAVLIDYGRVYFSTFLLNESTNKTLMNRIIVEIMKNEPSFYNGMSTKKQLLEYFMKKSTDKHLYKDWLCEICSICADPRFINSYLVPVPKQYDDGKEVKTYFDQNMCMFDISTISLNIIKYLQKPYANFLKEYIDMTSERGIIILNFKNVENIDWLDKSNSCGNVLLAGVFWFYLYIDHIFGLEEYKDCFNVDSTKTFVRIKQNELDENDLIYWSMQYLSLPSAPKFAIKIYEQRVRIHACQNVIFNITELKELTGGANLSDIKFNDKEKRGLEYNPCKRDNDGRLFKCPMY